jgi:putative chitinase
MDLLQKLQSKVPAQVLAELPMVFNRFKIDTPERLSHFLGQCSHESGGFKVVEENLYYTDAERMAKLIFKRDFDLNHDKTINPQEIEFAKKYVKNPKALANFVYANQNGNGNEASGDGYKHRGMGYIQLTGKTNQEAFDMIVDDNIMADTSLIAKKYPLLSAGFFWGARKLNVLADRGVNTPTITIISERVNGGHIGLDDRIKLTNYFYGILKA